MRPTIPPPRAMPFFLLFFEPASGADSLSFLFACSAMAWAGSGQSLSGMISRASTLRVVRPGPSIFGQPGAHLETCFGVVVLFHQIVPHGPGACRTPGACRRCRIRGRRRARGPRAGERRRRWGAGWGRGDRGSRLAASPRRAEPGAKVATAGWPISSCGFSASAALARMSSLLEEWTCSSRRSGILLGREIEAAADVVEDRALLVVVEDPGKAERADGDDERADAARDETHLLRLGQRDQQDEEGQDQGHHVPRTRPSRPALLSSPRPPSPPPRVRFQVSAAQLRQGQNA